MLSKRKSYIEKSLNEAEENKKDAIARLLEAEKKRLAAYEEAQLIIDRAKDEANFEGESILQLAKDDAKAIYANAKRGAKQLQQEIVKDNDRRVNELAINVCETIMHKKITKSDNDNIIRNIIKNVDKNGGKDE
jgi:F-type H+-transporting ATPase subunit b